MLSIHDRLSSMCKKISAQDIWTHLSTLYDLQALVLIHFSNLYKKTELMIYVLLVKTSTSFL